VNDNGKRVAGFGTVMFGELTNGRYVTIARSDLSRAAVRKAKETTEIIFGNEMIGLEETSDGPRVRLKHGGERQFDLVIGADGLHSGVRRLAFGPSQQLRRKSATRSRHLRPKATGRATSTKRFPLLDYASSDL